MRKEDSFRDFVLDQLRSLEGITCRAMFGGSGEVPKPRDGPLRPERNAGPEELLRSPGGDPRGRGGSYLLGAGGVGTQGEEEGAGREKEMNAPLSRRLFPDMAKTSLAYPGEKWYAASRSNTHETQSSPQGTFRRGGAAPTG